MAWAPFLELTRRTALDAFADYFAPLTALKNLLRLEGELHASHSRSQPEQRQLIRQSSISGDYAELRKLAEVCSDLASLSDPHSLDPVLQQACALLGAQVLIIWVVSDDGSTLTPVAAHGLSPMLHSLLGKIPRDSTSLVASAFRDNSPKVSSATAAVNGALAVALCGPSGPSGVLSTEFTPGSTIDDVSVAFASIIAAQLATLTVPAPSGQLNEWVDGAKQQRA